MKITGLFETHLTVADLGRSGRFYGDVLGLPLAYTMPARRVAFYWIGAPGSAMLGLWEAPGPIGLHLHLAFQMSVVDILHAVEGLRAANITPRNFDGAPCDTPCVIGWMPAIAVYFTDPDGHSLEFLSMLPDPPRPEIGVVPWLAWQEQTGRNAVREVV